MNKKENLGYAILDHQKKILKTNLSPDCLKCINECYPIASTLKLCLAHQEKRRQMSLKQNDKIFYFCSAHEEDLKSPTKFKEKCQLEQIRD